MRKQDGNQFDLNSEKLVGLIDETPFWSAPFGLKLLDKIPLRKNISAIDIGFGTEESRGA